MAIMDYLLTLADRQDASAAVAGSFIADLQKGGDAIRQELTFKAVVNTKPTAGTGLTVKLQTSDDNVNWVDMVAIGPVPVADLKAGAEVTSVRIPRGARRYLRAYFTPTGTLTGLTITAFLSNTR